MSGPAVRGRRRQAALIATLVALALLVALMAMRARRTTVTLSFGAADIQAQIDPKFPIRKNLLVASVTLSDPIVLLPEGSDRIGLAVTVTAQAIGGKPVVGKLAADGRLRYAADEGAFYLDDAKVTELHAPGAGAAIETAAKELATSALRGNLEKNPIYRLKPEDFRQALARRVLKAARVHDGRVTVVLGL